MDEDDEHCPSEFYHPEDLETFDDETETGITECHINKQLTYQACSGCTGEYWPLVKEVLTSLHSVHTAMPCANVP